MVSNYFVSQEAKYVGILQLYFDVGSTASGLNLKRASRIESQGSTPCFETLLALMRTESFDSSPS